MRKQKSLNNKGFSLVELIIVIAIMAILVGVLAPQLMKYVERSRQSKDIQSVDAVHTAVVTAMLDPVVDDAPGNGTYTLDAMISGTGLTPAAPKFNAAVKEILNDKVAADIEDAKFESKAYKGQKISIIISGSKVTCKVTHNSSETDAVDIEIE